MKKGIVRAAAVALAVGVAASTGLAQDVLIEGSGSRTLEVKNLDLQTGVYASGGWTGVEAQGHDIGIRAKADTAYETFGVYTTASQGASGNFGVYSLAGDDQEYMWNYGISTTASGGYNSYNYGISAGAYGGDESRNYAGYFDGEIIVTSCSGCTTSDAKLKKNVRDLESGLSKVMQLKPKSYDMRVDEYKGRVTLSKEPQFGLIAQDVQAVFPNLVKEVQAPVRLTDEERKNKVKKEPFTYLTLNYTALIPVMLKAIQEQQATIEGLRTEVAALKK